MDFMSYIAENALIVVPVLIIIGKLLKDLNKIDKYIPLILLPIGIILAALSMNGFNADSIIQGILVTGAAVYGNQLVKQLKKEV